MAYIGRDPQYGAFEKQTLTGDGSTVTFNLDYTVGSASSILVSVAGVHQEPESAYNLTSNGTAITFTAAPGASDTVFIIFLGVALEVATFGTGSITGFTVTSGATVDDVLVTENGVLQAPTTDYTISGTTLTFGTAPASGVAIVIRELP